MATKLNLTTGIVYLQTGFAIPVSGGGTGISSYTIGDMIYASGATTLSKLAAVAAGQVLISNGVGVAPSWSANPTVTSIVIDGAGSGATISNPSGATAAFSGGITSAAATDIVAGRNIESGVGEEIRANQGNFRSNNRFVISVVGSTDGAFSLTNNAASVGIRAYFDVDDVIWFKNRSAGTDTATVKVNIVNATGKFQANGTDGVATFGPAAVASITVKQGIVTAIS